MIDILYQDEEIVVAIKPVGVSAQATPQKDGMPDRLTAQLGTPIHAVHRLDLAVGGVMLLARGQAAMTRYTALMQAQKIEKTYLCVTDGVVCPQEGALCDLLYHDARQNRSFVVEKIRKGVKEARLTYQTLAENQEENTSLLRVQLQTGRTHQIRVQFSSRKTPLWGDGRYGSRKKGAIALWSYRLCVPIGKEDKIFCALPAMTSPWDGYEEILSSLDEGSGI